MRTSAAAAEKHAAARASRAALRSWATPIPPVPPLVIEWAPPREFSAYPYHSPLSERPPSELNHSRDPRRECLRDPYPYPRYEYEYDFAHFSCVYVLIVAA